MNKQYTAEERTMGLRRKANGFMIRQNDKVLV